MKHPDLLEPLALAHKVQVAAADLAVRQRGIGLVIDNFAGGGGASTGIEAALGQAIDCAINHDPEAIAMHRANHPGTRHYCQSAWKADPRRVVEECGGGPIALAWFSPDCKHFSKAKGGKPVQKNIRDLAWVVVTWAQRVRPRVIMLENVEEFITWAPLGDDGRPVAPGAAKPETLSLVLDEAPPAPAPKAAKGRVKGKREGETFQLWIAELRRAGYRVQWRELRACDYGAPTSRKRLFIIARSDGEPIAWPDPTHGKPGSAEVLSGQRLPWRTAAEIIDWSIPCPSIFERKKPLKDATCRRIAHGIMRFVVNSPKPFIVPVCHTQARPSARSTGEPLQTVTTAKGGELAIVAPVLTPLTHHGTADRNYGAADPVPTVTGAHRGEIGLVTATIVGCGGRRGQSGPVDVAGPYPTTTAKADACLVTAALISNQYTSNTNGGRGDPRQTFKTITTGGHHALVAVTLERQFGKSRGADAADPLPTITAGGSGKTALLAATLIQAGYGERAGQAPRVLDLAVPLGTIVAGGVKHSIATAVLVPHVMTMRNAASPSAAADQPARTITAGGAHLNLVSAFLHKYRPHHPGQSLDDPAPTVTANSFIKRPGGAPPLAVTVAHLAQFSETRLGRTPNVGHAATEPVSTIVQRGPLQGVVASSLVKLRGTSQHGQAADEPLHTVSAGGTHFAEVAAFLVKYYGNEQGAHGVEKPIDTIPTKDRYGLITVTIDGEEYVIADIGMRMLTPRELARAQGFPDDYILDPIVNGKPLTKTGQIRMIGNSVCPPLAEALVRANLALEESDAEAVAA